MGLCFQAHLRCQMPYFPGPRRAEIEKWNKLHPSDIYSRKSKSHGWLSREEAERWGGLFSAIFEEVFWPLVLSEIPPKALSGGSCIQKTRDHQCCLQGFGGYCPGHCVESRSRLIRSMCYDPLVGSDGVGAVIYH